MGRQKPTGLQSALDRNRKLGSLLASGESLARSGTASTAINLRIREYLEDIQGSYSGRGESSGTVRSRNKEMFAHLDRLDRGDDFERRHYARALQEITGLRAAQAAVYVKRWLKQKGSG